MDDASELLNDIHEYVKTTLTERLRAVMVNPTDCPYCEGTGWVFNDKSYDGYPYGRGPYIEPDDLNGGYHACTRCNSDHEVDFDSREKGVKVEPWRRWDDDEIAEIVAALTVADEPEAIEYHCPACGSTACDCEGKHVPEGDRAQWEAEHRTAT